MVSDACVLEELKARILQGDYAPRQRLVEADLCEDFGASRFAVRAALQSLEADGLVERQRHRGARIREITLAEAVEITEVRMVLEGLVARRAAERVTEAQAEELRATARTMQAAVAEGDIAAYGDLTMRIHQRVRDIAAHGKADALLARLHGQMVRHQFAMSRLPGRARVSVGQHQAIVDAVVARDPEVAEAAMRGHIASVIEGLHAVAERDVRRG